MSKERLEEFKDYIDFLDDSQDMQDHGRFVDTLHSLYEDGWFDWIYLYAKEQAERVPVLEFYKQDWMLVTEQNQRYREAISEALTEGDFEDAHDQLERIVNTLNQSLDSESNE